MRSFANDLLTAANFLEAGAVIRVDRVAGYHVVFCAATQALRSVGKNLRHVCLVNWIRFLDSFGRNQGMSMHGAPTHLIGLKLQARRADDGPRQFAGPA